MFHFVPNLQPYTFHRGRGNRRFDAYLLSADYFSSLNKLAQKVIQDERVLVADNGMVDIIRQQVTQFKAESQLLDDRRKLEEQTLGHYARPGELSNELTADFQDFARTISNAAQSCLDDSMIRSTVALQTAMLPTYLIGVEDITVAVLTSLNIEPEYSMLPLSWYASLSESSVEYAQQTRAGTYGPCNAHVFACVNDIDYDTAYQTGKLAAQAGVDGIATGLVGALTDYNYVDYRVQDGELINFERAIPRPYLRVIEIISGHYAGYAYVSGKRPRFHALGAGSPILLVLIALLGDLESYTAVDSTAPIMDAVLSSRTLRLYVDKPAPLKLKTYRIAEYWLADGIAWECECPYCRNFNTSYPAKLQQARAWWQAEGCRRLNAEDMRSDSPLSEYLPLLASPAEEVCRREAALARIGHNHWTLQRIERNIRKHSTTQTQLRDWVAGVMDAYQDSHAHTPWKLAALHAWQLADATLNELQGIDPSGTL